MSRKKKKEKSDNDIDNNFTKIDLDSVEAPIEEATGDEQEKQKDHVVFVQEPATEDKPVRKKRARKKKVKVTKQEEPDAVVRPSNVHPNHWRIAMANARTPFIRGED